MRPVENYAHQIELIVFGIYQRATAVTLKTFRQKTKQKKNVLSYYLSVTTPETRRCCCKQCYKYQTRSFSSLRVARTNHRVVDLYGRTPVRLFALRVIRYRHVRLQQFSARQN